MKTHDDLLYRIRRLQSPQDVSDILEALVAMPGAVRVKSVLRDRIAAMVEDNTTFNITPAEVRDILGDMTDTFLDGPSVQAKDSSIVVDRTTPGVVRLSAVTSGGTPTPTTYPTLRFGTSTDETPTAAELTIVGALGQGTVPAYAGNMHLLIARLASEGGIASVLFSDDASRTNQMGAFTLFGSMVDIGGDAYNVWVSNQALTQGANVTITVS